MTSFTLSRSPRRWLRYAEEDLVAARVLASDSPLPSHACQLAQQVVEKALKAALTFIDIDPPKSHNLDALRNRLPGGWRVQREFPDLAELSIWNAAGRYPGDWPEASIQDARAMVALCANVFSCIREDLATRGLTLPDGD